MKDSGSKMCGIKRLDGTSARIRSTQKTLQKHKCLQEGLNKLMQNKFKINPLTSKRKKEVVHIVEVSYRHSTFDAKSWKPEVECFWTLTFGTKS